MSENEKRAWELLPLWWRSERTVIEPLPDGNFVAGHPEFQPMIFKGEKWEGIQFPAWEEE